jgi:hypothetical protein
MLSMPYHRGLAFDQIVTLVLKCGGPIVCTMVGDIAAVYLRAAGKPR